MGALSFENRRTRALVASSEDVSLFARNCARVGINFLGPELELIWESGAFSGERKRNNVLSGDSDLVRAFITR